MVKIAGAIQQGRNSEFRFDNKGFLRYGNKLYVLYDIILREDILREAHNA